jgi:hypothetical protein
MDTDVFEAHAVFICRAKMKNRLENIDRLRGIWSFTPIGGRRGDHEGH